MEITSNLFVGREAELALVGDLIAAPSGSRRVLFIKGPGGRGKTWLLHRIYSQCDEYHQTLRVPLTCARVVDMDDLSLRFPPNLEQRWVDDLGREWFTAYENAHEAYTRLASTYPDKEWLQEADQRRFAKFIEDYCRLAEGRRILLLIDTVERIHNTELWDIFIRLAEKLPNTVWVFAGRDLDQTEERFRAKLGNEIVRGCLLEPFTPFESEMYFRGTEIGSGIDPDLREKLTILTGGQPVLLALAVEWLKRDMPLDGITGRPLAELQNIPAMELQKRRDDFKQVLVNKILELSALDQTFLLMAFANRRFNAEILSALQDIPLDESTKLIQEASPFGFVKPRAQGGAALHDEMQALVMQYSWSRVDPHETLRKQYGKRLIEYYDQRLAQLAEETAKAQEQLKTMPSEQVQRRLQTLQQQNEVAEAERFYYLLEIDSRSTQQRFVQLFDKATQDYRMDFRALLWQQMEPHQAEYTGNDYYEVAIRGAKYWLDASQWQKAHGCVQELYRVYARKNPHWRLDMLLQMANNDARLGKTQEALDHLEEALEASKTTQQGSKRKGRGVELTRADRDQWRGRIQSARGWILRLQGKWSDAESAYEDALKHSRKENDTHRIAQLLNNLGYVRSLLGDQQGGLDLSKQALTLWQSLKRERWIAIGHSTIGDILSMIENYVPALEYYDRALQMFREREDWEWITTVCHEKAYCKWLRAVDDQRQLNEALVDIEEAFQICTQHNIKKELPNVLHRRGHIYLSLGRIDDAEQNFKQSLAVAEQIQDNYRVIDNLVGLEEITYRRDPMADGIIAGYVDEIELKLKEGDFEFPLLQGRAYRILGDALFADAKWDQALRQYERAYPLIAKHGGFGDYRLSKELERLAQKFSKLDRHQMLQWCDALRKRWKAQMPKRNSGGEVLIAFCDVQRSLAKAGTESIP